ncbi:classical arabinogalactan protein 9-like [Panicum virgatum]|uniref:Uncharacterized protein n=1 Tax=Panicum virgatum TaxID=38727 RepID=A0A8T0QMZ3_PANVG|nr:classical arabinogalactan protein 9-like [Panicum virgatum]KAG2574482.1 hypothetical protein PVAP13_7KG329600 [Panicum virgatum]
MQSPRPPPPAWVYPLLCAARAAGSAARRRALTRAQQLPFRSAALPSYLCPAERRPLPPLASPPPPYPSAMDATAPAAATLLPGRVACSPCHSSTTSAPPASHRRRPLAVSVRCQSTSVDKEQQPPPPRPKQRNLLDNASNLLTNFLSGGSVGTIPLAEGAVTDLFGKSLFFSLYDWFLEVNAPPTVPGRT